MTFESGNKNKALKGRLAPSLDCGFQPESRGSHYSVFGSHRGHGFKPSDPMATPPPSDRDDPIATDESSS